jgi:nucleotide-binding universal stress UspA family protein
MQDRAIVVATDGSAIATETVRRAAVLARTLKMTLHVIASNSAVEQVNAGLPRTGFPVEVHETADDLTVAGWEFADQTGADLLVVGKPLGANPLRRLLARLDQGGDRDARLTVEVIDFEALRGTRSECRRRSRGGELGWITHRGKLSHM